MSNNLDIILGEYCDTIVIANFPIEISEPLSKISKLNATLAFLEILFGSGRIAFFVGNIMRPSDTATFDPKVSLTLSHMLV